MRLPECYRFPKHWASFFSNKSFKTSATTPPSPFILAYRHCEVEPKLFQWARRLCWIFDGKTVEGLIGNVNHGICLSGEEGGGGGGVKVERFYQEPNPPNAALNKNETDKTWRSHHRNCNIRQTGGFARLFFEISQDIISAHWLISCFCLNLEDSALAFPLPQLTRHLCSVWAECQGSVGDCRSYQCWEQS